MITHPEIEDYCKRHTQPDSGVLQALRDYTHTNAHGSHMLSDILVGRTLQFLLRAIQARMVLDLGTYTGYSALSMAEALPDDGVVISCDKSIEHLQIAQSFFAKSIHGSKIRVFEGQGRDCIAALTKDLDFAFVDADKVQLLEYITLLYPKLRTGGIIVIDNALGIKSGNILKLENKNLQSIHALNEAILNDVRFVNILLPIREGLNIISKL